MLDSARRSQLEASVKALRGEGQGELFCERCGNLCIGAAHDDNEAMLLCGAQYGLIGCEGVCDKALSHGDGEQKLTGRFGC